MALNLFQNILQSAGDKFLGKPQPMSFETSLKMPQPQAPRTNAYVAPQTRSFFPQAKAGQSLVTDDEIKQMIDAGASDKEIEILVSELEKERSGQQAQPQPTAPQPEKSLLQRGSDFLSTGGDAMMNVTGGAVEQGSRVIGNVAGEGTNLAAYTPGAVLSAAIRSPFVKETYGELRQQQKQAGEPMKQMGEQGAKFIKESGTYNPESTGASVGRVGTNILSTFVGPGKIFKTAEKANVAIKALAGLANTSIEGTTAAVSNYVATEGRLPTAKEVGEFVAVTGGLKGVGNIFGSVKKIPTMRITPTTITQAATDVRKGLDIGETISKTGISFTKGHLLSKLQTKITGISNVIDRHINNVIKETGPNNVTISQLTDGLKKRVLDSEDFKKLLKGTPIDIPDIEKGIDETITAYKKLYKGKNFDLNAQQQLKKDITSGLEAVYNKSPLATSKISARQAAETELASTVRKGLEEKVPEIKRLNQELAPLLEASKRIRAKGDYKTLLVDSIIGSIYASSQGNPISDPVGYMKNFAIGVLTKHLGTSTVSTTTASTVLKKTEDLFKNKAFQKYILDQYRQSNQ